MDIKGKVCLVTGGAFGIGKKITENLLQKGAKGVVILDINEENGQLTQQELEKIYGSGKVVFQKCDVSNKDQMKAGFDLAKSKYGALHIVCNNAGIWNEVEWERMFEVNVNGIIIGTKIAIDYLEESGTIVNMASMAGLCFIILTPMYCTAKAAVINFTRCIAYDPIVVAKKLRINCICPGAVGGTNLLPSVVVEEKYRETFTGHVASQKKITTDRVADAVLMAIEEDHHGQSIYVLPADATKDIGLADDSNARFRRDVLGMQGDAAQHFKDKAEALGNQLLAKDQHEQN